MATAPQHADRTASEARRPEAGSRAGGVSRAERGNDGSPTGAKPRRGFDAQHDSATGHLPGGRGRPHDFNEIPVDSYPPSHRQNGNGMDIRALQDDELMAQARDWRQRALRGEKDARGLAHELECEVRRRFPRNNAPHALPPIQLLGAVPQTPQRRWKPW